MAQTIDLSAHLTSHFADEAVWKPRPPPWGAVLEETLEPRVMR